MAIEPFADNFSYVIPVDYTLHTLEKAFCYDSTCGCHDDQTLVAEVDQHIADGLMTPDEATDFVKGKGI
jgi:hypothetical protein